MFSRPDLQTPVLASLLLVFGFCLVSPIHAQPIPDQLLRYHVPDGPRVSPGDTFVVPLTLEIHDHWHINSNPASMDGLIPTSVKMEPTGGIRLENVTYPEGESFRFEFVQEPITVYQGRTELDMEFRVRKDHPGGVTRLPLELTYQACDDTRCLPPETEQVVLNLQVSGESGQGGVEAGATSERSGWESLVSLTQQSDPDALGGLFSGQGIVVGLLIVFLLGLSLNLTPCVYPMVPITVGYFGSGESGSLSRRFGDALFFVLGMAVVYTILGALAGMGGRILGDTLQSPWVQAGLAGVMVVLSGTMFGFYQFRLPAALKSESATLGKVLGTFGMGMTLGVVAAPCLAPATVALLGYVGNTQNVLAGAGLFFVLSLGLGLPYVFLALFSSQLSRLPGSGEWMEWVKKLLGFIILGVAVYFLWPMLSNAQFGALMLGLIGIAGSTLLVVHPPADRLRLYLRSVAVVAVSLGLIVLVGNTFLWAQPSIHWESGKTYIREMEGKTVEQPTMVYLSADWCVPCKEMEVTTYRDEEIQQLMSRIRTVKIDLSNPPPEHVQDWLDRREVLGVPTIFFFTPTDGLRSDLTMMGYASAREFKKPLQVISTE